MLRVNEDGRPQWNALHERFQVLGVRVETTRRGRDAYRRRVVRPVDREPVTALPAGGCVRLVAGEREDAASVVRAVRGAGELVGDRVAAGGRRRAGPADADGCGAEHTAGLDEPEAALGEVDADRDARLVRRERGVARLHPSEPAVREVGAGNA